MSTNRARAFVSRNAQVFAAGCIFLFVTRKYEIRSGRRIVSHQYSVSPLQAVVDYVRAFGTPDAEIVRLGVDTVSWRGARVSAALAQVEAQSVT